MFRNVLDKGTAHVLVEVSKADERLGYEHLMKMCDYEGKAMRWELQKSGKTVLRTYKILAGLDVKVFCDWVILGRKESIRSSRNSKKNHNARLEAELDFIRKGVEKYGAKEAPVAL
jgi:hypothetical protein